MFVAGVDEVGVGPLAGPVTGGVVLLESGRRLSWYKAVRDSKVLSAKRREGLAEKIRGTVHWAVASATHDEIDRIGILPARRLCILRAIDGLPVKPDAIISDALDLPLDGVRPVIDGDALSVAVAAASIVAKVDRDERMREYCREFPGYGFCQHKGYPTPQHKQILRARGPSPIHRQSFAPVAQASFGW